MTIAIVFDHRGRTPKGHVGPVELRITNHRKSTYINTGIRVKKSELFNGEIINHPNAHYIEGIEPLAKWMQPLAERRFLNEQFEDVAYFVPFYLKDFVAIKSKPLL